jgi:cardiolipin synthase
LSNDDAAVAGMAEVVSRRGKARPSARATIPNALSAARLAAVPIFVWLFGRHEERAAVLVFGGAALTDAFDGLLARRTGTESELGKLLDPLADRVFISAVVVALVARGTLARPLAAAIVGRDLLILLLWPLMERRGIERIRVNAVGKSATALLLTGLTWLALSETSLAVSASRRLAATVVIAGGAVLYWGAGLMYATEARRRLRGLA